MDYSQTSNSGDDNFSSDYSPPPPAACSSHRIERDIPPSNQDQLSILNFLDVVASDTRGRESGSEEDDIDSDNSSTLGGFIVRDDATPSHVSDSGKSSLY
jgi:hypothetical protein